MRKTGILGILLCALAAVGAAPVTSGQSADDMMNQIKAVKTPDLDPSKVDDPAYKAQFEQAKAAYQEKTMGMVKAFFDSYPDDTRAKHMMLQRWLIMAEEGKADRVMTETDAVLAKAKEGNKNDPLYVRAVVKILGDDREAAEKGIDAFIAAAPKESRGAGLLFAEAGQEIDGAKQRALYQRIVDGYGQSKEAGAVKGRLQQINGLGKPFELTFTDAVSGKEISLQKDLKGKVVVVDFWATWCMPCVAEMPANKAIYEKFKGKGVEFVGVSLDLPGDGLQKLKDFVADKELPWPQYYEGKGWESDFSKGWGIDSVPTIFVVDKKGNLASVSGEGKLEELIPKLLAE
ncbi:MAG TPA: TlpA disulfide reductase family protein [Phycisphaerae bacterium]|nr:TlpA disulfide reductase family protein [Phycisphaerae bacterium]